jgi:hypothetical protein
LQQKEKKRKGNGLLSCAAPKKKPMTALLSPFSLPYNRKKKVTIATLLSPSSLRCKKRRKKVMTTMLSSPPLLHCKKKRKKVTTTMMSSPSLLCYSPKKMTTTTLSSPSLQRYNKKTKKKAMTTLLLSLFAMV